MKNIKSFLRKILKSSTINLAMTVAFVTVMDWPCFFLIGEPELPKKLLKIKKNKYGEIHEDSSM